ncbi:MAG: cytochrome c [Rhizobiaceae bacterium]|nr:cytochrome c [Rhizobiaceae bacterium]
MKFRTLAAGSGVLLAGAIAAYAHSGATGVIKERMDMMVDIAAQMKAVGQMIRGNSVFDADRAAEAAAAIADHAGQLPELFPEQTLAGPSEAAADIWDNWDEFVSLSEQLELKADALAEASVDAAEASDIVQQFRALGRTCQSCHEDFRTPG